MFIYASVLSSLWDVVGGSNAWAETCGTSQKHQKNFGLQALAAGPFNGVYYLPLTNLIPKITKIGHAKIEYCTKWNAKC